MGKAVMVRRRSVASNFDLVCEAVSVLMRQGAPNFDDGLDELMGLAIVSGERLVVTANRVIGLAETGGVLADDD